MVLAGSKPPGTTPGPLPSISLSAWLPRHPLVESIERPYGGAAPGAQEGPTMEHVDVIGCLSQRSRLERLQALADAWTREQLTRIPGQAPSPTLIALADGGRELVRDLAFSGSASPGTLDGLIPQQG